MTLTNSYKFIYCVWGPCHDQLGWSQRAWRLPCSKDHGFIKTKNGKRKCLRSDVPKPNLIGFCWHLKAKSSSTHILLLGFKPNAVKRMRSISVGESPGKLLQSSGPYKSVDPLILSDTRTQSYSIQTHTWLIRPSMGGVYGVYGSAQQHHLWYDNLKTPDSIMSNQS